MRSCLLFLTVSNQWQMLVLLACVSHLSVIPVVWCCLLCCLLLQCCSCLLCALCVQPTLALHGSWSLVSWLELCVAHQCTWYISLFPRWLHAALTVAIIVIIGACLSWWWMHQSLSVLSTVLRLIICIRICSECVVWLISGPGNESSPVSSLRFSEWVSEWVSRFLITHQHSQAIQCHSHWFMLENAGQNTD